MNEKLKKYLSNINGVCHTTFDPHGPGCVRVHLIPPEKIKLGVPWVIILNGQDILPITCGWAILLREFIIGVNKTNGEALTDEKIKVIINEAVTVVAGLFPNSDKKIIRGDLVEIVDTLVKIAHGKTPDSSIGYMTIAEYAKYMKAPHRMDLMISAMTKNNNWHCNQKCLHCYAAGQKLAEEEELSTDDWKKIIDKCRKACIPQITFTGGEPTMRDDLVGLIDYSRWFVTRLNTNGRLLTKELCKQLYDASLDAVQITFYSNRSEIHNLLVGAPGYNETVEGIKNALEAGLNVSLNTPLCELNKDYLETVVYAHEVLGIKYFTCSGLILTGNAKTEDSANTRLSREEILEILTKVTSYCYSHDLEISFTSPGWVDDEDLKKLKLTIPSCGACMSNMAISPSGEVIPCQSWLSDDTLGNMLNTDWKKIWNSKKCKEIRKKSSKEEHICQLAGGKIV